LAEVNQKTKTGANRFVIMRLSSVRWRTSALTGDRAGFEDAAIRGERSRAGGCVGMRRRHWISFALCLFHPPAWAADVVRGAEVFQACIACHGDHPGDLGPSLIGVVGRKAGSRDDFRYSGPMSRADFSWDTGKLREFIHDPLSVVKGTRMPFGGLADDRDVDDLVAFLASRQ
jgi:cytochrome c